MTNQYCGRKLRETKILRNHFLSVFLFIALSYLMRIEDYQETESGMNRKVKEDRNSFLNGACRVM